MRYTNQHFTYLLTYLLKNFEDMYNCLHTIPACDGWTDGQTSCHGIVRAMHTRRAVKMLKGIYPYGENLYQKIPNFAKIA